MSDYKTSRYGVETQQQQYLHNTIYYDLINRITIDEIIKINRYLQHNLFLERLQSKGINVSINIHLLYHGEEFLVR